MIETAATWDFRGEKIHLGYSDKGMFEVKTENWVHAKEGNTKVQCFKRTVSETQQLELSGWQKKVKLKNKPEISF